MRSARGTAAAGLLLAGALIAGALVAGCAPGDEGVAPGGDGVAPGPEVERAAETIDAATLERHVRWLGDDARGGRAPASAGDAETRRYLAEGLAAAGFEPAGDGGGWEQPFAMVGVTSSMPAIWTFEAPGGAPVALARETEFVAWTGRQQEAVALEGAELVFAGYGIQAPEYGWDDYAGADVRGKVVLLLNNDPDWDPELFAGERRLHAGRWDSKYETAARNGAAGAILIHTRPSAGYPWEVVRNSWTGEQFELPAADGAPRLTIAAWTTEAATRRVLEAAGRDLDALVESARSRAFAPEPLGIRTSLALTATLRRVETANVLGRLPGSDPERSREAVVYTAHHDHLGTGGPEDAADRIYNGALDNGAGVAQVLAIADAFAALAKPPRRSILVAFVGAEEQGLLGSEWLAEHPPLPPGRMAAAINFDGGNIWGRTRDVPLIGHGKTDLDALAARLAERQGRRVVPEPFPDRGLYYRSDQFSLARIGVPALYFDTGTDFVGRPAGWGVERIEAWEDEHYHQPSDEWRDDWNLEGMVEDARLGFLAGWVLAERDALAAWTPGDEFEDERQAALAALEGPGD